MAKAPPKPAADKPEKPTGESPEAMLAKFVKANEEDLFDLTTPVDYTVPSGSLNLDMEIGGFKPGCNRAMGGPNLGKTPFVLNVADNFLDTVKNARVLWDKAEGRLSEQNLARVRHPVVFKAEDWKVGTIYVTRCNIYETWISMMRHFVVKNPTECRYMFVTDSLDSMNLKNDMVKDIAEGNKVAGAPLLTKQMFQKMNLAMTERGHMKWFIGQRTASIKLDPYTKEVKRQSEGAGGNAAAHFANEALEFEDWQVFNRILEDPKDKKSAVLGHTLTITLKKTAGEKRFTQVKIPIRYGQTGGNSIWREREIADQLETARLIEVGNYVDVTPPLVAELKAHGLELPLQFRSLHKLCAFLDDNRPIVDYLDKRFRATMPGAVAAQ